VVLGNCLSGSVNLLELTARDEGAAIVGKKKAAKQTSFTIRQILPDGTEIEHRLHLEGDSFVVTTSRDGQEIGRRTAGSAASGILEAIQGAPELLQVGTGLTEITTTGPVDVHAPRDAGRGPARSRRA